MEPDDYYKSGDIKIAEVDTFYVNSQVLAPFCISWSKDNKILVNVEGGAFVFEFWPTPVAEKPSVTFLKFWIPSSTSTPLANAVVENENGTFLWSLNMRQAYEAVIDSTLSNAVQRPYSTPVISYFVHCEFSPLIGKRSYLSCLTNVGLLEIYKDQLKKWIPVVNVTELWISHCNFKSDQNQINFNSFKSRMFQLKIITMKWVEKPEIIFITGHENGMIVFWNVSPVIDDFCLNVQHVFCVDEKPDSIQLCSVPNCENSLMLIGFLSGNMKCFLINLATGEMKLELTLWEYKDSMVPNIMLTKTISNKLFVCTIKRHIILVQSLLVSSSNVELVMTKWEEFPTAISGWEEYQDILILSLQNHDMCMINIKEENDKKFILDLKPVEVEIKPQEKTSYERFGLAMSQNKIIWILVSSSKLNYDSSKGVTHLTIYSPKWKIFKSLIESTSSRLIEKILVEYKEAQLNEIFDILELKKLELFKGIATFSDDYLINKNLSVLKLQLMLWEIKLKVACNFMDTELPVAEIEHCILKKCVKKNVDELQKSDILSPVQKKCLLMCQLFIKDNGNRSNLIKETCPICGCECDFYNTRFLSCPNHHTFPRCCLSLLPCDEVPYAICRLCDAVALLCFVSDNNSRCPYCDGLLEADSRLVTPT